MLTIYKPELKDYWYEKKINEDANSMSYNAGYDVSYYGYHYDTGQIDFPENRWEEVYNKRKNDNKRFFAYLKDIDSTNKYAVIMGNEGSGVNKDILDKCDEYIYIPMNEKCESLNVGVATSIILYEMRY